VHLSAQKAQSSQGWSMQSSWVRNRIVHEHDRELMMTSWEEVPVHPRYRSRRCGSSSKDATIDVLMRSQGETALETQQRFSAEFYDTTDDISP
jgi:hypothetical protein